LDEYHDEIEFMTKNDFRMRFWQAV